MVIEWKEFLWDVPEERLALWAHCHTLFYKHSYPPLQVFCLFEAGTDGFHEYSFIIFYFLYQKTTLTDNLVFGQSGLFFLKHAESMGKDLTAQELHEVLLLSLQWLSGMITQSHP